MSLGAFESLLASRLTWGRTPAQDAAMAAFGWEAWLARQLDPASIDDRATDALFSGYQTLTATNEANAALLSRPDGRLRIVREISHATFLRFVHSERQVHEVLVDFWTNHFNIALFGRDPYCVLKTQDDREVVRRHALGRFADLLAASAHSPAMLVYLDNCRNDARAAARINENYGRELLELHTLGIIDGQTVYDEQDVVAVARVLTGWTITTTPGTGMAFTYRDEYHDRGPASILGGAWSTPGRSGEAGYQDGVSLLAFLARHPSTARYLAWKLCRRLVADDPPDDLVASAARVYLDHDTAIVPVLDHIVHSPAFAASTGAKLRRGLDQAVAAFRAVGAVVDPDPLGWGSTELHAPAGILLRLGQRLFWHDTPDGYPETREDWLSADGLLRRWELGGRLANNAFGGVTTDLAALLPEPRPTTAGELLDRLAPRVLGGLDVAPRGFTDVAPGSADARAIDWAAGTGVMPGRPDGSFRPRNPVKRQAFVTMLWAAAGRPAGAPASAYVDVPASAAYRPALDWATAAGVVAPGANARFRPKRPLTRAQLATMAWHAAERPGGSPPSPFRDVPRNAAYRPAVDWAAAQGLLTAHPDGTFRPAAPATRAQVARLLFARHAAALVALPKEDRERILPFFGGATARADDAFLRHKAPDLLGILLSLPCFQYR